MIPDSPYLPAPFTLHPVKLLAHALNLLTRQQPWAAERLARHAGQTLRVCLGSVQLTLTIEHNGHLTAADSAVVPDVVLELIADKFSWAAVFDPTLRVDLAQCVHITGQAALAQVVSDLARDLRPDPEDALAQWVGDVPARRLVTGVQGAFAAAQSFARNLTENIAEYLAEESNTLAGTPALASLAQEGVRAVTRLEQLERRQAALQARLAGLTPRSGSPA